MFKSESYYPSISMLLLQKKIFVSFITMDLKGKRKGLNFVLLCFVSEDYFRNSCYHNVLYEYQNNLQCSFTLILKSCQRSCFQLVTLGFPFWKKTWCEEQSTWLCAALSSPARHPTYQNPNVLPAPLNHRYGKH